MDMDSQATDTLERVEWLKALSPLLPTKIPADAAQPEATRMAAIRDEPSGSARTTSR
jgi:hypothetical protein